MQGGHGVPAGLTERKKTSWIRNKKQTATSIGTRTPLAFCCFFDTILLGIEEHRTKGGIKHQNLCCFVISCLILSPFLHRYFSHVITFVAQKMGLLSRNPSPPISTLQPSTKKRKHLKATFGESLAPYKISFPRNLDIFLSNATQGFLQGLQLMLARIRMKCPSPLV